jgi:hypothetical protein
MAEADLDVVIRSFVRTQAKALTDAAKKRQGWLMGMAGKAKDKESRDRYRHLAKTTRELAAAAARRLQVTAENTAESYARSIKRAAEEAAVAKPANEKQQAKPAKDKPVKAKPAKAKQAAKPARKKKG